MNESSESGKDSGAAAAGSLCEVCGRGACDRTVTYSSPAAEAEAGEECYRLGYTREKARAEAAEDEFRRYKEAAAGGFAGIDATARAAHQRAEKAESALAEERRKALLDAAKIADADQGARGWQIAERLRGAADGLGTAPKATPPALPLLREANKDQWAAAQAERLRALKWRQCVFDTHRIAESITDDPDLFDIGFHDGVWKAWSTEYSDEGHIVLESAPLPGEGRCDAKGGKVRHAARRDCVGWRPARSANEADTAGALQTLLDLLASREVHVEAEGDAGERLQAAVGVARAALASDKPAAGAPASPSAPPAASSASPAVPALPSGEQGGTLTERMRREAEFPPNHLETEAEQLAWHAAANACADIAAASEQPRAAPTDSRAASAASPSAEERARDIETVCAKDAEIAYVCRVCLRNGLRAADERWREAILNHDVCGHSLFSYPDGDAPVFRPAKPNCPYCKRLITLFAGVATEAQPQIHPDVAAAYARGLERAALIADTAAAADERLDECGAARAGSVIAERIRAPVATEAPAPPLDARVKELEGALRSAGVALTAAAKSLAFADGVLAVNGMLSEAGATQRASDLARAAARRVLSAAETTREGTPNSKSQEAGAGPRAPDRGET